MYFWENNYERAFQWAQDKKKRGTIKKPAVIGAILHLGYCCDLLDAKFIQMIQNYYMPFKAICEFTGNEIPRNKDV